MGGLAEAYYTITHTITWIALVSLGGQLAVQLGQGGVVLGDLREDIHA